MGFEGRYIHRLNFDGMCYFRPIWELYSSNSNSVRAFFQIKIEDHWMVDACTFNDKRLISPERFEALEFFQLQAFSINFLITNWYVSFQLTKQIWS